MSLENAARATQWPDVALASRPSILVFPVPGGPQGTTDAAVGWDTEREDFRHFRMDRTTNPEAAAGTSFRRRHVPFEDDVCPYSESQQNTGQWPAQQTQR